jgi:iron complex transport system permease protein
MTRRLSSIARVPPFLLAAIFLGLSLALSVMVGSVAIPAGTLVRMLLAQIPGLGILPDWPTAFSVIVFQVRLPHALLILLTGAALSGAGAAYQGLFRNPLADPYLLGSASGAGLGAVLVMSLHWPQEIFGYLPVPLAAFAGALAAVFAVYHLAREKQTVAPIALILAGVAVSAFASSLTSYLMLQSGAEIRRALAWLLGGSSMSGWLPVLAALPYVTVGLGVLTLSGHALNVLQSGEEQARQMGLNAERAKVVILLAASFSVAAAVAFSGIIGFIGLIVPHVARLLWGPDYRRLIPLSVLGGAGALLLADLLARNIIAPQILPIGVVTALFGSPFFLWVLRRSREQE